VYCEDYAGYFTVILPFLAFYFCSAYFIYLVSCIGKDEEYVGEHGTLGEEEDKERTR
jgi:hypothetical protein